MTHRKFEQQQFGETQESRREIVFFQQYQDQPPVTPSRSIPTTEALHGREEMGEMGETSEILQPHSVHPVPQEDVFLYSEEPDQKWFREMNKRNRT